MPDYLISSLLLFFCWIAALAILLIFLESWFGVTASGRFVARRASGAYGICSVFVVMRGPVEKVEKTVRSIFAQSYPFVEVLLVYSEDDSWNESLAHEFRAMRPPFPVRLIGVPHRLETAHDRVRALEQSQSSAKGRWYIVVDPDVVLDRLAVEASMEFAGSGEFSALALRPGTQCASLLQRVLAPSMEYLFQMLRVVERRRERSRKMDIDASYLLLNRESFDVVNRINRLPGILNEAGWNIWSYQVEGFRTFEGDGSRWVWREVGLGAWYDRHAELDRRQRPRVAGFVIAATIAAMTPVAGLAYAFTVPIATFFELSILSLSAVSYALLAISYYLYGRRLHAAAWFAPLWFVAQLPASFLMLLHLGKSRKPSGRDNGDSTSAEPNTDSPDRERRGRRGQTRESFRYD
jgi:hypothetical protein